MVFLLSGKMRRPRFSWAAPRFLALTLSIICILLIYIIISENYYIYSICSSQQLANAKAHELKLPQSQPSVMEKVKSRPLYNLMEEKYGKQWFQNEERFFSIDDCTMEYANERKLQQDHPCVIHLIQNNYLKNPAPRSSPYKLDDFPKKYDPSDGQSQAILKLLGNRTNGFFIEAGANDGEFLSNTVYMERFLNWTGLLVEGNEFALKKLMDRNRKAFILPGCISTKPYPMKVLVNETHSIASFIIDNDGPGNRGAPKPPQSRNSRSKNDPSQEPAVIIREEQCFPLYSILLAIGRTQVDFFSLDVEGAEYKILSTIPWHKVDITVLCVEWNHIPEGEPAMTRLMESNKFIKFGFIELDVSRDVVYMKDVLADYRFLYYDDE